MAQLVVNTAVLQCTPWGVAPSTMIVLPVSMTNGVNQPAATIMDNIPMTNIMTFGMCSSLANPTVSAATAAASGVLTPMPCIPNTPGPWVPGSPTVMIGGKPALNSTSKLMCLWGGTIGVTVPGQFTVNVP